MIPGLGSHQRDLVVPTAKQSPDSIQFTLNRRQKRGIYLTADYIWTPNLKEPIVSSTVSANFWSVAPTVYYQSQDTAGFNPNQKTAAADLTD